MEEATLVKGKKKTGEGTMPGPAESKTGGNAQVEETKKTGRL